MRVLWTRIRAVFIIVVCAAALGHMLAVTLAAVPPNRYSQAAQPLTSYLSPYFTQNWRLFAPHPIATDRTVWFQGAWLDVNGDLQRTAWVNWSDVELNTIRRHLVGRRGGYVTNKLYGPLSQNRADLLSTQREIADEADPAEPPSWQQVRQRLIEDGNTEANTSAVFNYLRYDRAATRLASDVLASRWPDRNFTAVRYRLRSHDVVPYDSRGLSDDPRAAARPEPILTTGGWRTPAQGHDATRRAVADYDSRHR